MCACGKRQMYLIKQLIKEDDPTAITIIIDTGEVMGEGFLSVF